MFLKYFHFRDPKIPDHAGTPMILTVGLGIFPDRKGMLRFSYFWDLEVLSIVLITVFACRSLF
jgi:hypothetical protein